MNPTQNAPFVERLESAGLVSLVVYDEHDHATRVSLWPGEANALADQLHVAAKDVRNA